MTSQLEREFNALPWPKRYAMHRIVRARVGHDATITVQDMMIAYRQLERYSVGGERYVL